MSGPQEPRRQEWSALGRSSSLIVEQREYNYRAGYIVAPHGIVGLYDQAGDKPYTSMSFVFAGRHHSASWHRSFSDRRLKTLARRFAAEIAEGEGL